MMVEGVTYGTDTPVGKTYITINHDENRQPFEVFITVGKSGSDVAAMADALGRMISLNLRINGVLPPRERIRQVVAQLIGIGGAEVLALARIKSVRFPMLSPKFYPNTLNSKLTVWSKTKIRMSHGVAVNAHLNGHTADCRRCEPKEEIVKIEQLSLQTPVSTADENATRLYDICPECGAASFAYEEGCKKCYACGYSEC